MFIRTASALLSLVLLAAFPAASRAQDATTILQTVQQAIGGKLPRTLRIEGSGSGYALVKGESGGRQHFRIEEYRQELDLGTPSFFERLVRVEPGQAGAEGTRQTETRAAKADAPWSDQYAIWTNPLGFLAGATSRQPLLASETLLGTPYTVVTFTTGGQQVRGYVNEKNVLERTRTEVNDLARGTLQLETVYMEWADFDGMKFPTLIIHKENGEVARILIVRDVDHG